MTYITFAKLIRKYTGTDATSFPDADILTFANAEKDTITGAIAKQNEDYFGMRYSRPLKAGKREYSIPDEVVKIKYVEAIMDGVTQRHLDEFDLNTYRRATDEATILEMFAGRKPQYDIFRRSLWIYSGEAIIDVPSGLIFWAIIYPTEFTDLGLNIDMSVDPDEYRHGWPIPFQELLARAVSIAWKTTRDRPIPLTKKEQLYEEDLKKALASIRDLNADRSIVATIPYNDGQDY